MYDHPTKDVMSELGKKLSQNRAVIPQVFQSLQGLCTDLVNSQYRMAGSFVGMLQNNAFAGHCLNLKAIFKAFHANLFHFYSALQLTEQGLVGSVGPILRVIFEALLVGKYSSLSEDSRFFENWEKGGIFEIRKGILRKIRKPAIVEIPTFWEGLCHISHSSIYAGQVDLSPKELITEISGTYSFLIMTLLCNYHLLNRHLLTPQIVYYIERYRLDEEFTSKRRTARAVAKSAQTQLKTNGKRLVKEYSASWTM